MAFNWSEYLAVARWLAANAGQAAVGGTQPSEEAMHRAAISRAYYGAFGSAMALLVSRREYTPQIDGTDHGLVAAHFRQHNSPTRKNIGQALTRLRDRRRRADYDASQFDTASMCHASITAAQDVIARLKTQ